MGSDENDKMDEVANDLDEVKTAVEELAEADETGKSHETIERLKTALEQASDAADDLEDER